MTTLQRESSADKAKRKHNPEMLRAKRIARAVGIPWAVVTKRRDELREKERASRFYADSARETAWAAHNRLNGWGESHNSYWRSGFDRYYGKRLANGSDYTCVPRYDEIADAVRESHEEWSNAELCDVWDFLLSEFEPLQPIEAIYQTAMGQLCYEYLDGESLGTLREARAERFDETPF